MHMYMYACTHIIYMHTYVNGQLAILFTVLASYVVKCIIMYICFLLCNFSDSCACKCTLRYFIYNYMIELLWS